MSRSVEGLDKRLPLFRRSDELALVGKHAFCLQAGAIKNEVRHTKASHLGPSTNEFFLTVCGAEINAPSWRQVAACVSFQRRIRYSSEENAYASARCATSSVRQYLAAAAQYK
jgi:hypothetical protein